LENAGIHEKTKEEIAEVETWLEERMEVLLRVDMTWLEGRERRVR